MTRREPKLRQNQSIGFALQKYKFILFW